MELGSDSGSTASTLTVISNSSRLQLARAERERRKVEAQFDKEIDELDARAAMLEANSKNDQATMQVYEKEIAQAKLKYLLKTLEIQRRQLLRKGEIAGLDAEIRILESQEHKAVTDKQSKQYVYQENQDAETQTPEISNKAVSPITGDSSTNIANQKTSK